MVAMSTAVLLVIVLCAVTVSPWAARTSRLPAPTVQFLLGCLLAAVPATGRLQLSAPLILLVVLPMVLFWEGYQTSVLWARRHWRPILLNGVFLVVLTAGVVATVVHAFGFPWPAAWALGAVIAPTDASAVTAFGRALPTSWTTALRAESLINDGTALVILAVALEAADHRHFGAAQITLRALQSYGVGITVGLVVVGVMLVALPRISDPLVNGSFALVLPFLAAVPASALGGSGVVAVVTCGLVGSRASRLLVTGRTRLPVHAFWQISTFVLSGALFVLAGTQLRTFATGISAAHAAALVGEGLLLTAVIVVLRFVWVAVWTVIVGTLDRRPAQRALRVPFRARVVTCWAGLRGGVSLAAALTVPRLVGGAVFPHRRDLLALTFVVVTATLLLQGATLNRVIAWAAADIPADTTGPVIAAARLRLTERLRRTLEQDSANNADPLLQSQLLQRLAATARTQPDQHRELDQMRLDLTLLARKREQLIAMVRDNQVEDTVMWEVQTLLDNEETRLEALLAADQGALDRVVVPSQPASGGEYSGDRSTHLSQTREKCPGGPRP